MTASRRTARIPHASRRLLPEVHTFFITLSCESCCWINNTTRLAGTSSHTRVVASILPRSLVVVVPQLLEGHACVGRRIIQLILPGPMKRLQLHALSLRRNGAEGSQVPTAGPAALTSPQPILPIRRLMSFAQPGRKRRKEEKKINTPRLRQDQGGVFSQHTRHDMPSQLGPAETTRRFAETTGTLPQPHRGCSGLE